MSQTGESSLTPQALDLLVLAPLCNTSLSLWFQYWPPGPSQHHFPPGLRKSLSFLLPFLPLPMRFAHNNQRNHYREKSTRAKSLLRLNPSSGSPCTWNQTFSFPNCTCPGHIFILSPAHSLYVRLYNSRICS